MEKPEYEATYRLEDNHWWFVGMRRVTDRLLAPYVDGVDRWERLLDAGCGTGGNSSWLSRYCRHLVSMDISPVALSLFQARGAEELLQASAAWAPFGAESFDAVTCFDVISHIPPDDDRRALDEFYRLLRPGGLLVLRVPAYEWLRAGHDEVLHTTRRYTAAELTRRLVSAGFRVLRLTYANTILFPVAAARRLLQKAGLIGKGTDLVALPAYLNRLFLTAMRTEARLVSNLDLPFGLSIMTIAQKPALKDA